MNQQKLFTLSSLFCKFSQSLQREGLLITFYKVWYVIGKVIKRSLQSSRPKPAAVSLLRKISWNPRIAKERAWKQIGNVFNHEFRIKNQCSVLVGTGEDFSGQEAVLVAHHDRDGIVDSYVKYLCHHLKEMGKKVLLCSASYSYAEKDYAHWVDVILYCPCQGDAYSFICWKAAMEAFPSLYHAEELTLCNDSIFAPVGNFAPVYRAMKSVDCDFWCMVASKEVVPHLQSFYLVFNETALSHVVLKQFFASLPPDLNLDMAREIELRLGLWLELHGLRPGAFIPFFLFYNDNPSIMLWKQLLRWGCPIFKREHLDAAGTLASLNNWHSYLEERGYPIRYIQNYYYRLGRDISTACCTGNRADSCPPNIMLQQKRVELPWEGPQNRSTLAVILHCYYPDGFGQLEEYLQYLPAGAFFFISTDTEAKAVLLSRKFQHRGIRNFEVRVLPNIGFDIAPFIVGFRDVLLTFDLILKIHVKMSTHRETDFARKWKDLLYDSLVGDSQHVNGILHLFESDPTLGVLAPPTFSALNEVTQGLNRKKLQILLGLLEVNISIADAIDFPAGSMFWARRAALQPLLNLGLTFDDFETSDPKVRDGTLAHAVERSIFFSCYKAGLAWGRVPPAPWRVLAP